MARFKLPESMKAWKVVSSLPDNNGNSVYEVSRKETDGSVTNAVMTYVAFQGDDYNSDNVQFINEEAAFIRNVINCGEVSNYIDAAVLDKPSKSKIGMFIITQKLTSLEQTLMQKNFTEDEINDFGLQMSDILTRLEARGIYHGNIKPSNIFVTQSGAYKLGGFTDFESKISDLSFVSPEIKASEQPDFTTDIYSVGLIMYEMANDGAIPFESETVSREDAINKRFEKQSISAPKNGSEKLKSVIVIACQPDKQNRWKNAGNLKNALASIKAESEAAKAPKQEIIPPAPTEFDGNVFEEFVYDDFEEAKPEPKEDKNSDAAKAAATAAAAAGAAAGAAAAAHGKDKNLDKIKEAIKHNAPQSEAQAPDSEPVTQVLTPQPEAPETPDIEEAQTQVLTPEMLDNQIKAAKAKAEKAQNAQKPQGSENEIDNRVFDDYQVQTKVFNINDVKNKADKDYGDYFDDEPEPVPEQNTEVDSEFGQNGFYDDNSFYAEQKEEEKRNRKGMIIAIIAAVIVVASLAVLGVVAATNGWFGGKDTKETQPSTEIYTEDTTVPATTQQPTTAAPTTEEPTTESEYDYPFNVVGAYYDYAKSVLEEQGYKVVKGEYADSEYYDEGIVTSMSPDPEEQLKKGSTITLNISSGLIQSEETQANDDEDENNNNDDENYSDEDSNEEQPQNSDSGRDRSAPQADDTSYSKYKGNTSYLSQSEVNSMSRSELNLALNEIYARRGRIFKSSSLSSYFNAQSWYTPKYTEDEFSKKVTLNDYENKNIQMILDVQQNKGYR